MFNPNLYGVHGLPTFYSGGGGQKPRSNSGISLPIVTKLGIIIP